MASSDSLDLSASDRCRGTKFRPRHARPITLCDDPLDMAGGGRKDAGQLPAMTQEGLLPAGRHRTSLDLVHARFVEAAPNSSERAVIFRAFLVWADRLWSLAPSARLWLDGGFVTHKAAAPHDIDVAALLKVSEFQGLTEEQYLALATHRAQDGRKVQPMGGLVNGFFVTRGAADQISAWQRWWSSVVDSDKHELPGVSKGFVEVMPGERTPEP